MTIGKGAISLRPGPTLAHTVVSSSISCVFSSAAPMRGSNTTLVGMLGILTLIDGERVVAGLGEGVDLDTSAVGAVSPGRNRLALLGNGLVEVGKG
jgi:hypothetical protein